MLTLRRSAKPICLDIIMLTYPCIVDPITHHFYTVKLGFTGGIQFFLFLLCNIYVDCGYSLEAVLTCTHNQCFKQKKEKYNIFSY